jgi:hypothetical protein
MLVLPLEAYSPLAKRIRRYPTVLQLCRQITRHTLLVIAFLVHGKQDAQHLSKPVIVGSALLKPVFKSRNNAIAIFTRTALDALVLALSQTMRAKYEKQDLFRHTFEIKMTIK